MTGSTKYASQHIAFCSICENPIPLEITATDENGEAVHEDCYASHRADNCLPRRLSFSPSYPISPKVEGL